ncbi:hypothetical protein V8B97DRAFT_2019227 [Scleroderma yunnanense]
MMDELTNARVELNRLKEREKELISHPLGIRAEISAQHEKISSIIKLRSPVANSLSLEKAVAGRGVSVLERSCIEHSYLMEHYHDLRGGQCVHGDFSQEELRNTPRHCGRNPLLCTRLPLCVVGNDKFIGNLIVKKTKHLHFPSLKRVTIPALGTVGNPNYLFSSRAPTLEHLQLGEHPEWQDFSPTITLRTLELTFRPYPRIMSSPSFPYLIPTQTLIALSLSGNIRKWDLRPNSIPFPHLSSLTLHINTTTRFWGAIVAPNIERFIYSPFSLEDAHSDLQVNFGSKFDRVRYLRFLNASPDPHCDIDPEQLFQAFPHVRHVELDSEPMLHFSVPRRPCGQFCADIWSDLASLTIHGLSISWRSPLPRLWEWLKERKKFNIHPLHVKVTGIERGNSTKVHEYFLGFVTPEKASAP